MKYFAYGSNMSISRLRERTPSAEAVGCFALARHDLRFHKSSVDGSGKCDAFYTGAREHVVLGRLFDICPTEKPALDQAEGLGYGYDEKTAMVRAADGGSIEATLYIATDIDNTLLPYSWYLNHVLVGAGETSLPHDYVQSMIAATRSIHDPDTERDRKERAIHAAKIDLTLPAP